MSNRNVRFYSKFPEYNKILSRLGFHIRPSNCLSISDQFILPSIHPLVLRSSSFLLPIIYLTPFLRTHATRNSCRLIIPSACYPYKWLMYLSQTSTDFSPIASSLADRLTGCPAVCTGPALPLYIKKETQDGRWKTQESPRSMFLIKLLKH